MEGHSKRIMAGFANRSGPGPASGAGRRLSRTLTRPKGCAHSMAMRASAPFLLAAALAAPAPASEAPPPSPAHAVDPDVREIVSGISPERIQRSIYVLASFKTRHTLSDPLPSGDGIGGAASWIRAEFDRASAQAGGGRKGGAHSFEQPPSPPRNPQKAQITNIVATLKGTDPDSEGRTLVVSGHYDSRATSLLDAASPAPGADDDASGVASVLEVARVLSHFKFRATIVFLAVAGEEQGLYGSTHWAQGAKERRADIEAMLDNDIIGSSRSEGGKVDRGTVRLFAQGIPPVAAPDEGLTALIRAGGEAGRHRGHAGQRKHREQPVRGRKGRPRDRLLPM